MKIFWFAIIAMLFSAGAIGVEADIVCNGSAYVSGAASNDKDQDKLIEQLLTVSGMEQSLRRMT